MESINGVSFEDWGAACGNIAAGMSEEEVIAILGIELPVWQQTNEAWGAKLADLMAEDINVATTYSNFFTNPKVGKFAGVASNVKSIEDLLAQVPDFDTYQKIFYHQSAAAQHGIDPTAVIEEYGFNLQDWGQLGQHYSAWYRNYLDINSADYNDRFQETKEISDRWQAHWKDFYQENAANLADDIDF